MATESPLRLVGSSTSRNWPISKDAASYASSTSNMAAQDLGLLLQGHGFCGGREFTGPNRSGSAPPSMEGSSLAIGDLRSQNSNLEGIFENLTSTVESHEYEEQLRADPTYLAYYHSNVNLNPRLPRFLCPEITKDWSTTLVHLGKIGEHRPLMILSRDRLCLDLPSQLMRRNLKMGRKKLVLHLRLDSINLLCKAVIRVLWI